MTQQFIDTTAGAGDTGKAGGDKINANFSELYAQLSTRLSGRGREVLQALSSNQSTTITVVGDSTAATTMAAAQAPTAKSWTYRTALAIAGGYPSARVEFLQWDDGTSRYLAPYVVQAGADGERYLECVIPANASTFRSRWQRAATTPNPTGNDLELETKFQVATSGLPAAEMCVMAHSPGGAGRQFQMTVGQDLSLNFDWNTSTNAGWLRSTATAAQAGIVAGVDQMFRATLLAQNGQGGYTVTFFKSTNAGATWTQIAQNVNTTAGSALVLAKPVDGNGVNLAKYEVGGVQDSVTPFAGRIYQAIVRDGIGGPLITPYGIENYVTTSSSAAGTTLKGSPTLYWFNGARAGQGFAYFSDAVRFPKLVGPQRTGMVMVNDAKNEGSAHGSEWTALLDTWDAQVVARAGQVAMAYVAENPSLPSVLGGTADLTNLRIAQGVAWAQRKGYAIMDPRPEFYGYVNGIAAITKADGLHPTSEDTQVAGSVQGYQLWAEVARRFFGLLNAVALP